METEDFDYALPAHLIAQHPTEERTGSRLLRVMHDRVEHLRFGQIVTLLRPGDLLVVNNTRVMPARMHGYKETGGRVEVLVERVESGGVALCHLRSSKPLKAGRKLVVGDHHAVCLGREGQFYRLRFDCDPLEVMQQSGHMPLPPYIEREDGVADTQRYQTVRCAKVVLDENGYSKGYGFVRFGAEAEQQHALANMTGEMGLGSKPIK